LEAVSETGTPSTTFGGVSVIVWRLQAAIRDASNIPPTRISDFSFTTALTTSYLYSRVLGKCSEPRTVLDPLHLVLYPWSLSPVLAVQDKCPRARGGLSKGPGTKALGPVAQGRRAKGTGSPGRLLRLYCTGDAPGDPVLTAPVLYRTGIGSRTVRGLRAFSKTFRESSILGHRIALLSQAWYNQRPLRQGEGHGPKMG